MWAQAHCSLVKLPVPDRYSFLFTSLCGEKRYYNLLSFALLEDLIFIYSKERKESSLILPAASCFSLMPRLSIRLLTHPPTPRSQVFCVALASSHGTNSVEQSSESQGLGFKGVCYHFPASRLVFVPLVCSRCYIKCCAGSLKNVSIFIP